MTHDVTAEWLTALQARTTELTARLQEAEQRAQGFGPTREFLLGTIVEDFARALEALHVSEEELRVQGEELTTTQGLLEQERQRYQDLFEYAPDAYLVTDPRGHVQEANRAAGALLRMPRKYMLGKPLGAFVEHDDVPRFHTRLARLAELEGDAVREWELRLRPRGYRQPTKVIARVGTVSDTGGTVVGLRWLLRDITGQKRAEAELRQLQVTLERQVRERTGELASLLNMTQALLESEQRARATAETALQAAQARLRRLEDGVAQLQRQLEAPADRPALRLVPPTMSELTELTMQPDLPAQG